MADATTKRMRCRQCGPVGTKAFFDRTNTGWVCRCCGRWEPHTKRETEQEFRAHGASCMCADCVADGEDAARHLPPTPPAPLQTAMAAALAKAGGATT